MFKKIRNYSNEMINNDQLRNYNVIIQVTETEVVVVKIEQNQEKVFASVPVEESEVEIAKQELTVNVLRVMMVSSDV